jgi:SagB-type dehydrogenase family enzyme
VAYWSGGFRLYNYETRLVTSATPLAVQLLEFFEAGRSVAQAQRHFRSFDPRAIARAVRSLERRTLLQRAPPRGRESGLDAWDRWSPAAPFFHFSTKDVAFVGPSAGDPGMVARAGAPPPAKRIRGAAIQLPPEQEGAFGRVLQGRRTWRRFARQPLPLPSLATLLGLTFRRRSRAFPGGGRIVLRTSPSPGARQALEAYVLARNVAGLPRGLYHYAADRHRLTRMRRGATRDQVAAYLPTQGWYADAAALVLITAVFPRVWSRYDYPRAYRAVLIEAGHFCQTFLLTATWLGLAPFCSMALADSRIERDLGVDGVTESVLYAAGVGVRPDGVDWAPVPASKRGRMSG